MKRPHFPALHLLVAFESAARLMSFKRAADEIGVTPSALSQRISRLEQSLDAHLFERGNREIALTPSGTAYLLEVRQALTALASVTRGAGRAALSTVTLAMNDIVAHELVIPNLPRFGEWAPEVEVNIRARISMKTYLATEPGADGIDGGIRIGTGSWPGFTQRLIGPLTSVPLCAPALASRIRDWDDLHRQTLYCPRTRRAESLETLRHPENGRYPHSVVTFETLLEAMRAVEAGMGVMSGMMPLMNGYLLRGRLAVAVEPERPTPESLWLLTPSARPASACLARLGDWLVDSFARLPRRA
jgi:LysR family glycine cleavage system transcriptional activator